MADERAEERAGSCDIVVTRQQGMNAVGEDTTVSQAKAAAVSQVGQCGAGKQQQQLRAGTTFNSNLSQVQQQQFQHYSYMSPAPQFLFDFYQRNLFERLVLPAATYAAAAAAAATTAAAAASSTSRQRLSNSIGPNGAGMRCKHSNRAKQSESCSTRLSCCRPGEEGGSGGLGGSTLSRGGLIGCNIKKQPRHRRKRRRFRKRKQRIGHDCVASKPFAGEVTPGIQQQQLQQHASISSKSNDNHVVDDDGVANSGTIESESGSNVC